MHPPLFIPVPTPDATADLAARVGDMLAPGDCLLLSGPIGAGKTHFSRSLIQSLLSTPEDVPSPTFTLVQVYDCPRGQIWHADLYRLGDVQEIEELGLSEAFENAICLVEWPDRLGPDAPQDALRLTFDTSGTDAEDRRISFDWTVPGWDARLEGLFSDA